MIYFSNVLTFLIFMMLGGSVAKKTMKYTNKGYNYGLLVLAVISFWIGKGTYLVKIFDFEVNLSIALIAWFLGILIRRLTVKYSLKRVN